MSRGRVLGKSSKKGCSTANAKMTDDTGTDQFSKDLPVAETALSLQISAFRSSFSRTLFALLTLEISLRQRNHIMTITGSFL
jgi:hypothetical protein